MPDEIENISDFIRDIDENSLHIKEIDLMLASHKDIDNFIQSDDRQRKRDNSFAKCFRMGFNEIMTKFLEHDKDGSRFGDEFDYKVSSSKRYESSSYGLVGDELKQFYVPLILQDFKINEELFVRILKQYRPQIENSFHLVTADTKENMVHVLLRKNMRNALKELIENYTIDEMYLGLDFANNSPSAQAMIYNRFSDGRNIANYVWEETVLTCERKKLHLRLNRLNKRRQNILHICMEQGLNKLFLDILRDARISNNALFLAVIQKNDKGLTPIDECTDEETVLTAMKILPAGDLEYLDIDGNNIFHINGRKNFSQVIQRIFTLLPDAWSLRNMLLQRNNEGDNALMVCVLKKNDAALNVLLMKLFEFHQFEGSNPEYRGFIKKLFHDKNNRGETLMGLILHFQQGTTISQTIAMEIEKDLHTRENRKVETMNELSKCLRQNVGPSPEVVVVLQDVDETFEKSKTEKFKLWLEMVVKDFLIPLGIMIFDIASDVALVYKFSEHLFEDGAIDEVVLDKCVYNDTSNPLEHDSFHSMITRLQKIPEKLNWTSRFFYSVGFLVIPWAFYFVEFCLSQDYAELHEEVMKIHL